MATFPDRAQIQAAINDVLKTTSFGGWVLLKYSNDTTIVFEAKGNGGVTELVTHLRDNEAQYALVRLHEKKGVTDCSRDVYIAWTGPKVSKIMSAKKATHSGDVQKVLQPNHAQLTAVTRENFTEDRVRERADPQSGSHTLD